MKNSRLVVVSLVFPGLFGLISPAFSASKAKPPEVLASLASPSPLKAEAISLSKTLEHQLTGLGLEDTAKQEQLKLWAKEYLVFGRSAHSSRGKKAKAALPSCVSSKIENPFCDVFAQLASASSTRHARSYESKWVKKRNLQRVKKMILQRKIEALQSVPDTLLLKAMGEVSDFAKIKVLAEQVLAAKDSMSPALTMALGARAEGEFPDTSARALAVVLYDRARVAGKDSASTRAAYRLAMIHIWESRWGDALAVLTDLVSRPEAQDYRSRALYWRMVAAKQTKNLELEENSRVTLIKEFPLSLHGMLAGATATASPSVGIHDPEIWFRSLARPEVNSWMRAAEALNLLGEEDEALDVLEAMRDRLKGTESAFQLYFAVMLMRSGEVIRKFQVLASLFRESPEYISKGTLEMLYPINRMELVKKVGATSNSGLDPYLLLSLMRQESAFNIRAKSTAGAMGLMQLMPKTARKMERRVSRKQLFNPEINVRLGAKYFGQLLKQFNGDVELALAGYNAGPDRVDAWKKRYPGSSRLLFLDLIPFRETREYVASIERNYYWYLNLYAKDVLDSRIQEFKVGKKAENFGLLPVIGHLDQL
ncbi:lytic transglycosylase domain-containing protein [Bdellovibrionota bacterium FG-2]